jgi:hypothetical protein
MGLLAAIIGIWLTALLLAGVIFGINRVLVHLEELHERMLLIERYTNPYESHRPLFGAARTAHLERDTNTDLLDLTPRLRTAVAFIRAVRRG